MSAPNLKEIEWAISELESQESTESRYTLLAARSEEHTSELQSQR